ncbi:MAG: cytoplasmic protein [Syntrophus sp. (in: bacteria)]|nr:cytoplasmic protein [Syntrophus sp. (in: bacteria)]
MLAEPACYTRRCRHYKGVIQPDGTEATEDHYCTAFPEGIPFEISSGNDDHLQPIENQGNDIVYERKRRRS